MPTNSTVSITQLQQQADTLSGMLREGQRVLVKRGRETVGVLISPLLYKSYELKELKARKEFLNKSKEVSKAFADLSEPEARKLVDDAVQWAKQQELAEMNI